MSPPDSDATVVYCLDRFVWLRDVVDALRKVNWHNDDWKEAADFIECTFGANDA